MTGESRVLPPARPGTPILATDQQLQSVKFDSIGLVVVVVQEYATREILMVAYMDAEALRRTVQSGRAWYYSRSRQEYWCKGETSGDRQYVRELHYDCDGDALLMVIDQDGQGACHTGNYSCFYRTFGPES